MALDALGLAKALTDMLIVLDVERSDRDKKLREASEQREKYELEIERLRKEKVRDRSEIHSLRQELDLACAQKERNQKDLEIAEQFSSNFDTAMLEAARLGASSYHEDYFIPTFSELNSLKQEHTTVLLSLQKQKHETMIAKKALKKFNDEKLSDYVSMLKFTSDFQSEIGIMVKKCEVKKFEAETFNESVNQSEQSSLYDSEIAYPICHSGEETSNKSSEM